MLTRWLFAVLVAAVLLWGTGGSTACWQAARVHHYRSAQQASRPGRQRSDILVLPRAQYRRLQWLRPGEVLCGNRHFDVATVRFTPEMVRLTGHFDGEDDRLASVLSGFWQKLPDGEGNKMPPLLVLEAVVPPVLSGIAAAPKTIALPLLESSASKDLTAQLRPGPAGPPPKV